MARRNLKRGSLAIAVGAALALVLAEPASAAIGFINVTHVPGGQKCRYTATKSSTYVRATNSTCDAVSSYLRYVSAAGNIYNAASEVRSDYATSYLPANTTYYSGHTAGTANSTLSLVWQTI